MSAYTWRFITNGHNHECEAVIFLNDVELERETFEDAKAANRWVSDKLREMGAL